MRVGRTGWTPFLAVALAWVLAGPAPANDQGRPEGRPKDREHEPLRDRPRQDPHRPGLPRDDDFPPEPRGPHPDGWTLDAPMEGHACPGSPRDDDFRPEPRPPRWDGPPPGGPTAGHARPWPPRDNDSRPEPRHPRPDGPPPGPPQDRPGPLHHREWEMMKDRDPEMFELMQADERLERQTMELVEQYHRASGERCDEVRAELEAVVNRHYDVRQQRRELELKRLEEALERMRESVERRNRAREEIIERHIRRLLGDDEIDF